MPKGSDMQVEFSEEITVEGKTSVTIDDITAALSERISQTEYATENANGKTQAYVIQVFVNNCFQCFKAITPAMRSVVSAKNRNVIAAAFQNIADDWHTDEGE